MAGTSLGIAKRTKGKRSGRGKTNRKREATTFSTQHPSVADIRNDNITRS